MKYNGIRIILIYSLSRQQLIDFIKRKDSEYELASFAWHSDDQLRKLAILEDKKHHAERQKNRRRIKNQVIS
jgi:transcription initiation factor IIE alpha subunit